jgi:hypothetical protein
MSPSLADAIARAENLSESSKTQYLEKLATLTKMTGKPVEWLLDHPDQVMATLARRYRCPLTQRAFVSAVKAVFTYNERLKTTKKKAFEKFTEFQSELSQEVTQRYMAGEPSDKERENWVPWAEVLAKEQELATSEFGSYDHLLLAMYCLIEPLRQDYGALRILVDREPPPGSSANYLVIARDASSGKIVLNSYKTAKKYGTFERPLPTRLLAIIRASLIAHPRAYLFENESGEPYRLANSFTQFSNRTLKRLFGKRFTVSLMRHSHISNIDFNASTPGELFQKSRNMAHSIGMQQLYRRKVEPASPPPPLVVTKQLPHDPPPPRPQPMYGYASLPAHQPFQGVVQGSDGERYLRLSI